MSTRELTHTEQWTIVNGLRAAADAYSTDAHKMDTAGMPTAAQGFRDQRAAALTLAERIEACERLVIER